MSAAAARAQLHARSFPSRGHGYLLRRGSLPQSGVQENRGPGEVSSYIEPGAPWENPYGESFNGRLRDEFLAVEQFDSLLEAQVLLEDWRIEYNTKRPHSSLGWLAPAAYAERWEAQLHAGHLSAAAARAQLHVQESATRAVPIEG